MRIILPSDVFPPRCGGAGWSAHALATALLERGHTVTALVPRPGAPGLLHEEVLGVPTVRWGYPTTRLPFVQNYFRHERLWPRFAALLVEQARSTGAQTVSGQRTPLLIHAQHVQVAPPAILAGRQLGAPVVVTVRDHWPWDYFATGLHGDRLPYPHQTWAALVTDLVARLGPLRGVLALPAIPYMLAHVRRRQRFLRRADAVIAVSDYIARRLTGIVAAERVHVIPNMIDTALIAATTATPPASVAPGAAYLLFVGKLERNKGAHLLVEVFRALRAQPAEVSARPAPILPELVIAGDGALRPALEHDLAALGVRARFLDWIDHDEALRLMAHCTLLLFPSAWGEPLSRILLEGMACGAPILAMPTGGTPSSIIDGVTGALEPTAASFARRLTALLARPEQRRALGDAARHAAGQRFATAVVVKQVEALYQALGHSG
jgi:glycosyltransferase involved in cell wall biosynthesis